MTPLLKSDMDKKTEPELEDMFHTSLSFGTGGMRGILGAGTNRMNRLHDSPRANDGAGPLLEAKPTEPSDWKRGVAIAYDNRHDDPANSRSNRRRFSARTASSAYLFDALRPTPELSFAVRTLKAIAGIVVTASHNPPNYNGYKIYDDSAANITPFTPIKSSRWSKKSPTSSPFERSTESGIARQRIARIIGKDIDDALRRRGQNRDSPPRNPETI
ncbi:MAG: hypothetical protein MZU97_19455 [Bacillus subtilis]|nr:hypothetical protein [Bacillus subtilis]